MAFEEKARLDYVESSIYEGFDFMRLILFLLILCIPPTLFAAGPEIEIRERVLLSSRQDNATGALAMTNALQDGASRAAAAAKTPLARRAFELVMIEAQDVIATFKSPDAMKVFAGSIPRLSPDALVTLLFGLKNSAPHAEIDAAASKMLKSGMDFRVRTALMEMLGAHKHAESVEKIALGLNPLESPSIQISACRALGQISDKKSIPLLIKYLSSLTGKGGRYKFEATAALRALSGEKLDANPAVWKTWWEKNQADPALNASKSPDPDYNFELSEKQEMEYYEVPVVENRLVIVFDCSGSMTMGGKPNRFEVARKELKAFINSLNEKQMFNLVCFSSNVRRWNKVNGLVFANEANKKDVCKFLDTQKEAGGTQTMLAMEDVLREISIMHGCETVYLVTDGNPNPWSPNITIEQQERLVRWINQPLKIRINTIGIYTITKQDQDFLSVNNASEDPVKMKQFLMEIAENNDGVYREVGGDGTTKVVKVETKKQQAKREKEEKEKAEKLAKEKEDKDKLAKEAAEKAGKDAPPKDPKEVAAKTEEPKETPPIKEEPAKKEPAIEVPRSDKDIAIPFVIEPPTKEKVQKVEAPKKEEELKIGEREPSKPEPKAEVKRKKRDVEETE